MLSYEFSLLRVVVDLGYYSFWSALPSTSFQRASAELLCKYVQHFVADFTAGFGTVFFFSLRRRLWVKGWFIVGKLAAEPSFFLKANGVRR